MADEYNAIIYLDCGDGLCHIRFRNISNYYRQIQTHERLNIPIVNLKKILLKFPNLMGDESTHGSFDNPYKGARGGPTVFRLKTANKKDYDPLIIATGAVETNIVLQPGGSVKKILRKLKKSRKTRRH